MGTGAERNRRPRRIYHEVLRRTGKPNRIQCRTGSQYAADVFPDVRHPAVPVQNLPQTHCHIADVAAHLYRHRIGTTAIGQDVRLFRHLGLTGTYRNEYQERHCPRRPD